MNRVPGRSDRAHLAPVVDEEQEPTAAELAAIDAEMPLIEAELAVVAAESRLAAAPGCVEAKAAHDRAVRLVGAVARSSTPVMVHVEAVAEVA